MRNFKAALVIVALCFTTFPGLVLGEWVPLPAPPVAVYDGAKIAFSYNRNQWWNQNYDTVWGIFPNVEDGETYFYLYDCIADSWIYPNADLGEYLRCTAITFQWAERPMVWVIGKNEDNEPMLYSYDLDDESWDDEDIDSFSLKSGAALAFRLNPDYHPSWPPIVMGWLYCLPGGSTGFWCYPISLPPRMWEPIAIDELYPGDGAVVIDQKPVLICPRVASALEYRFWVSTNPDFSELILDVVTPNHYYIGKHKLPNGVYYWRTACRFSESAEWTNYSAVHRFTIQRVWHRLPAIPESVDSGAALAYGYYQSLREEMLLAFPGGNEITSYKYVLNENIWRNGGGTPEQSRGSAIATNNFSMAPRAIFPEVTDSVYQYYYRFRLWLPDESVPPLPGAGAVSLTMAYHSGQRWLYVLLADTSGLSSFYRHPLTYFEENKGYLSGTQSSGSTLNATAHCTSKGVLVEYHLDTPAEVTIRVYEASGRLVKAFNSSRENSGNHQLIWRPYASGAYFVLIDIGRKQTKLKVVVQ